MLVILLLFITLLILIRQKNHFTNFHDVPNYLVYKFDDNLYKFQNNKLTKIDDYFIEPSIKIKYIKKKKDLFNISKECNKIYSKTTFKYKNCKNYCNFNNIEDKSSCLQKCEKYNIFSWNDCTKYFQNLIYTVN
jgi:hypothetical protein